LIENVNPGGRDDEEFRRRLRALRSTRGLSQEQLARDLGVSFATVNRWEGGKTAPSARARRELARLEAELTAGAMVAASAGVAGAQVALPAARMAPIDAPALVSAGVGVADSQAESSSGAVGGTGAAGAADTADSVVGLGGSATSVLSPQSTLGAASATNAAQNQATAQSATQLSSVSAPPRALRNIPVQSGFVGREPELAALISALESSRLVCLTGVGGAGKTRMAVEAAGRFDFAGEVVFVPLEPVRDPRLVATTVAAALGLRDRPGQEAAETIIAALNLAPRLLVLDGAEHLRAEVAGLARRLLAGAPQLRLLVTSQRVLGLAGEVAWPVPPLGCPAPGAATARIAASDAVELFVARARERVPGFTLAAAEAESVAELCRGLDGLPLAIELAAGWIGTLSVAEIVRRRTALLSRPGGSRNHDERTLRAVVQASYELLESGEQELVRLLSVFAGPFTLEDAQAVSGTSEDLLVHQVRSLVDASWLAVHREDDYNRFSMLSVLRGYADEQLGPDGGAVRRRHAEYYAELARGSELGLTTADRVRWAARLTVGSGDLQAALAWAEAEGENELGLDVSAALWQWWLTTGRLALGRGWISRFLAESGSRRTLALARALSAVGVLAVETGDYTEAANRAATALGIFEAHGEIERAALAATVLGSAHRYLGEPEAAREYFERAMRHRATLGDERGVSVAANNLALLALDDGDYPRAIALFEQALLTKRRLGDPRSVALGLANLSDVQIRTRRLSAAARSLDEAATLAAELGDRQLVGTLACNQGELAGLRRDWAASAACYRTAVEAFRVGGNGHDVALASIGLGRALHQLGRTAEASACLREAESLAAGINNPQRLAEARAALAEIGESTGAALPDGLTPRQGEVLALIAAGLSNREAADRLHLSVSTIERHLATIYRNLGLRGRVEAARYAAKNGLYAPPR
jgi:predicted ATPase/DNA-binding CsgD family transcriptional regulator/DNA-binding XRE family transcriptional regulator